VIDTTNPATHSIDYVVAGISGLTSTATRTVIVSAPANDNPQPQGAEKSSYDGNPPTDEAASTAVNE
jgi:hypothetical protein